MNSGATWTIADGGVSGKLWAGLHHDRSASPFHRACSLLPPRRSNNGLPDVAYGVIRVDLTVRRSLPDFPHKRTFSGPVGMSQTCQRTKSLRDSPLKRGPTRGRGNQM